MLAKLLMGRDEDGDGVLHTCLETNGRHLTAPRQLPLVQELLVLGLTLRVELLQEGGGRLRSDLGDLLVGGERLLSCCAAEGLQEAFEG